MTIPFIQYLRPDGERRATGIKRSPEIEVLANKIRARGLRFECEELRTMHVSFTIHDPVKGEDVAIQLCMNGPCVSETVDKLILEYAKEIGLV